MMDGGGYAKIRPLLRQAQLYEEEGIPLTSLNYREAGVEIDAGDSLVERVKPVARRTRRPEVMAGIGGFGALFEISKKYREPVLVSGTDGVGTKLKLAFQLNRHDTVGIDLVAMSVNDILVQGAEPLFFLDYFACGRLDVDIAASVIQGIAKGCELAGCALIGGGPGIFWTKLLRLHVPALKAAPQDLEERGLRLGKGLQITNILRDVPKDLRLGRCYLPEPELKAAGLKPEDLLEPKSAKRLQPVMKAWLRWGMEHLDQGRGYVVAMPSLRLRAAAAWPLLLSVRTLSLVAHSERLLEPGSAVKVSRQEVYGLLAATPWTLSSEFRFNARYDQARGDLAAVL